MADAAFRGERDHSGREERSEEVDWIQLRYGREDQRLHEEQLQNDRDVVWKQVDDGVENGRNVMLFVIARQGVVETTPQLERLCQD